MTRWTLPSGLGRTTHTVQSSLVPCSPAVLPSPYLKVLAERKVISRPTSNLYRGRSVPFGSSAPAAVGRSANAAAVRKRLMEAPGKEDGTGDDYRRCDPEEQAACCLTR